MNNQTECTKSWESKTANDILADIESGINLVRNRKEGYNIRKYFIRSSKGMLFENVDGEAKLFYPKDAYELCNKIIQEGGWAVAIPQ